MNRNPDTMTREELEEEVAYHRSELNEAATERNFTSLRRAFALAPTETRFLLALYEARGRTLSKWIFDEKVPPVTGQDRQSNVVAVYICRIRHAIGRGAVKSEWGRGYYLTPEGAETVSRAIDGAAA
jgi:DNA-binding response OmpR family regulator